MDGQDIYKVRLANLKSLLAEHRQHGWNQQEFSNIAGIRSTYMSQVLNGYRNPGREFCRKIEEALGLPIGYMDTSRDASGAPAFFGKHEGRGYFVSDHCPAIAVSIDTLKQRSLNSDDIDIYEVHGDAMSPTIPPGADVLVEKVDARSITSGVYLMGSNGDVEVVRLSRIPGTKNVSVRYDNTAYPPATAPLGKLSLIGRVVGVFHWTQ